VSARLDLAVRGGTVATASDIVRADIGIRDGRIVAIAEALSDARETLDASGLLVLPGGVDAHCHLAQPTYGGVACADDFESGTVSALCGGTTTVMPFATQGPGGGLVMVHAENHDCIAFLADRMVRAGHTAPAWHAHARPQATEREASHRAIALAEVAGAPLFLVHVSAAEAVEQIAEARARGLPVHGETCPQYLFLNAADLDRPGMEGAKFMCSPPPRDQAGTETLWRALQNGVLEVVSSDHSPARFQGADGKLAQGPDAPFTKIGNGVPGLETRLPLLFSEGVNGGRFDLCRFVALTATNPAKIYGLYPRKGTIAVGSDADLVLWDAGRRVTLANADLHHNVDYTPYEGFEVTGWPVMTLLRGRTVWNDGEVRAEPGAGRFLPCGTPGPVAAARAATR